MIKILSALTVALALSLTLASSGFAQSSIHGYNDVGGDVQNQVASPVDDDGDDGGVAGTQGSGDSGSGDAPSTSGETLPFTGLDLALIVGAGGLFLGLGLLVRRFTETASDTA